MNIKVKAAVEVAGGIALMICIVVGVRTILNALADTYGADTVINGIAFSFVCVASYVCVGMLYDIRVAKLEYRAKLKEMTKK